MKRLKKKPYVADQIERLELSQLDAAKLVDVTDRTMRRWISGKDTPPWSVIVVFECMIRRRLTPADISRWLG